MVGWPPTEPGDPPVPSNLAPFASIDVVDPVDLVAAGPANALVAGLEDRTEEERAAVNDSITLLNQVLDFFLERDGASPISFMRGALDMNSNQVQDLEDGVSPDDLVSKQQLEGIDDRRAVIAASLTADALLLRDGSLAMLATLDVGGGQLKDLTSTAALDDLTDKGYADAQGSYAVLSTVYLVGTGVASAMLGDLHMGSHNVSGLAEGAGPTSAVPKSQLDTALAAFTAAHIPLGMVYPWAGDESDLPPGWLLCDGSLYDEVAWSELFSVIGRTYGGSAGAQTYATPDLRGRLLSGIDPGGWPPGGGWYRLRATEGVIALDPNPWAGALGGADGRASHQLAVSELPIHTHGVDDHLAGHGFVSGVYWGESPGAQAYPVFVLGNFNTLFSGGTSFHTNVQETQTCNWIIKATLIA